MTDTNTQRNQDTRRFQPIEPTNEVKESDALARETAKESEHEDEKDSLKESKLQEDSEEVSNSAS